LNDLKKTPEKLIEVGGQTTALRTFSPSILETFRPVVVVTVTPLVEATHVHCTGEALPCPSQEGRYQMQVPKNGAERVLSHINANKDL